MPVLKTTSPATPAGDPNIRPGNTEPSSSTSRASVGAVESVLTTASSPARSEQGVDEGRHRRSLREHDQAAEQQKDDDDRQEPELLPLSHEGPELYDELTHV